MADRSARLAFILSLTDKVTGPLGKVKMKFNDLAEQSHKNLVRMGVGLAGLVGAGMAISKSLEPALEQNRALGEVKSLGVAEDALDALNRKSLAFSIAYGENAQAFVASAYSIEGAIKGLSGTQLATFTNTSNVLAKATKSDAETMGAYVGTLYNLNKQAADAMGKGAWVEQLGGQTALAVKLFRTSGAQIGDAFKAAGGLASTAGVDLAEQMAVLGTLGSTMEGGEAGGLYKAFFENISGASEKLGMSFVDDQGKLLPMMQILDKLKGKFGDLSIEANGKALRDAFGGEASRLITALLGNTERLANGMDQLGKVRGLEQAEQMAKAMVDPWQQFASAVMALRISFGQVLMPLLAPLMQRLTDIASTLTRWTLLFPNISRLVGILVLGLMGLVAAASAVTMVVGMAKIAWLALNVVAWKSVGLFLYHTVLNGLFVASMTLMLVKVALVKTAMLLWQGAIWLVNSALLANPVTWVVLGIVALCAALVAAVVYWDEIAAAIMDTAAFKWVSEQLAALSAWFDTMGGWSGMAKAAWNGIVGIFRSAINSLIELLNKIPGISIDTSFAELPGLAAGSVELPKFTAPSVTMPTSLSPLSPGAVPKGGLLSSIQNSQTNKGTHVEKVEIHTGKAMNPLELEQMMSMAVGG